MKLKTRLAISFCIIIFVPVALAGCALFAFQKGQLRELERTYGETEGGYHYLTNTPRLLSRYTREICEEIEKLAMEKPEELQDSEYLEDLNSRLNEKHAYLVVQKEGEEIFSGGDILYIENIQDPGYEERGSEFQTQYFSQGNMQYLLKNLKISFPEGEEGTIWVVTCIKGITPEMKELLMDMGISVVLILLMTAALLSIWIYKGIIGPIKKLENAALNIKEGNLDFVIEADNSDEIGKLCDSFEEMRQKLKESMEEKVENERENRTLISNIAHDLKTPITTVKGYAEGLLDGVADTPEKQEKYLRTICNKANEMDALLNELTLYSNIDTNRIPYNFAKLNIAGYFADCIEEIGMDLEAKGVGLSFSSYVDSDVLVIADPEQITRVIHNIIGNSIKYMDKTKAYINIRVKDVGDFVQIEIEDNGKGIAVNDLPYIFDRFYRADSSRNSATGGSGIGLSIVKKIIEDHGGKIWATSKEGTGTLMCFVLRKYQEAFYE